MEEIRPEDRLLRRIQYMNPHFIKDDGTPASSSFSLKRGEDGLSTDIERLTTYAIAIVDTDRFRLYALSAGFITSLGLQNIHDPKEENYAHALIKGTITRGTSRKLAKAATRIPYPR